MDRPALLEELARRAAAFDPSRQWVEAGGYRLSDAVWRGGQSVRAQIDALLVEAIRTGEDALVTAKKLEQYLDPAYAPRRNARGRLERHQAKGIVTSSPGRAGMGSFPARRLARTEVTRAHGQATIDAATLDPFTEAVAWNLSARHPKPDECCIGGTMIETSEGPRPIEMVAAGDLVLTHRGRYRPVTQIHRRATPAGSLVRLRCQAERGRILTATLTRNHPVLTDQGWVAAGDLQTGYRPVALLSSPGARTYPPPHDASCRASRGFGGSAPSVDSETGDGARCGGVERSALRIGRIRLRAWRVPNLLPIAAFGTCRPLLAPLPNSGFPAPAFPPRTVTERRPVADTCRDAAFRGWGWLRPRWARRRSSNTAAPGRRQTTRRTSRRSGASPHGGLDSRHLNRIVALACWPWRRTRFRRPGTFSLPDWSSPAPRTDGYKTAAWPRGLDALCHRLGARARFRTTHSVLSFVDSTMTDANIPPVVAVFNLTVDGDNSYFAGGIAVHNCDANATRDAFGLGAGRYPPDQVPRYPSHPMDICFLTREPTEDVDAVMTALRQQYGLEQPRTVKEEAFRQEVERKLVGAVEEDVGDLATAIGRGTDDAPSAISQLLREEEDFMRRLDYESALVLDVDTGATVWIGDGSAYGITIPDEVIPSFKDAVLTHNHPSGWAFPQGDPRRIGHAPSGPDFVLAVRGDVAELRAVTPAHRWSVHRPLGGWPDPERLELAVAEAEKIADAEMWTNIRAGTITPEAAEMEHSQRMARIVSDRFGIRLTKMIDPHPDF